MQEALAVHHPAAGDSNLDREDLLALLRRGGLSAHYLMADDPALPGALAEATGAIVVAGGDGTVARVVTQLPDRSIPIAILPLGGANNIARSLGLPVDLGLDLKWAGGTTRPLDVGRLTWPGGGSRRFVERVGLGALPATTSRIVRSGKVAAGDKRERARQELIFTLRETHPAGIEISCDDDRLSGHFLLLEAMNIAFGSSALQLAPDADPGDGCLDLIAVTPDRREAVLDWLERGAHGPPPITTRRRCRALELSWDRERLQVDDELPELAASSCRVELEREQVRVLIPRRRGAG